VWAGCQECVSHSLWEFSNEETRRGKERCTASAARTNKFKVEVGIDGEGTLAAAEQMHELLPLFQGVVDLAHKETDKSKLQLGQDAHRPCVATRQPPTGGGTCIPPLLTTQTTAAGSGSRHARTLEVAGDERFEGVAAVHAVA
jgi:hypothetical protein